MPDAPSWLFLIWTGLAALLAVGAIVAPLTGPAGPRGAVLFFRPVDTAGFIGLVALGVLLYPLIYALLFHVLHNATLIAGTGLGLLHGLLLVASQLVSRRLIERPGLTILLCTLYGAVFGFLSVVP